MPKKSNLPRIPLDVYQDILLEQCARLEVGAIGPTPEDPYAKDLIIDALLEQISVLGSEQLARGLQAEIQVMAKIEASRFIPPERKAVEFEKSWRRLKYGKLSGLTHAPLILQQQRLRLNEFIAKQAYPTRLGKRPQWLKTHRSAIVEILNLYPCLCRNHGEGMPSPYSIDNLKKDSLDSCKTSSEFVLAVIACAHGTTPAQVANLMKPSKKNKSPKQ